jgi:hypothetical protein
LLAPLVDWAFRFTVTSSPDLLTFRLAVAVSPLRVWAVVVRLEPLPVAVRLVVPLVRAFDQLPPVPGALRFTLLTDPRDRLPPPPPRARCA